MLLIALVEELTLQFDFPHVGFTPRGDDGDDEDRVSDNFSTPLLLFMDCEDCKLSTSFDGGVFEACRNSAWFADLICLSSGKESLPFRLLEYAFVLLPE